MRSIYLLQPLAWISTALATFAGYQLMFMHMGNQSTHALHLPVEDLAIGSYALTSSGAELLFVLAKHCATVSLLVFILSLSFVFNSSNKFDKNVLLLLLIAQILAFSYMNYARYFSPFSTVF